MCLNYLLCFLYIFLNLSPSFLAVTLCSFCDQPWSSNLVAQTVKRLSTMWETQVRSLGWEDPLEKGMTIPSSTIAWRIPWTEELGRLHSVGLTKSRTWLNDFTFFLFFLTANVPTAKWTLVSPVYSPNGHFQKKICTGSAGAFNSWAIHTTKVKINFSLLITLIMCVYCTFLFKVKHLSNRISWMVRMKLIISSSKYEP